MSYTTQPTNFLSDLERTAKSRQEIATHLSQMVQILNQAETEGKTASGKLELEQDLEDLTAVSCNLQRGVFRLIVLGDMKRGKSTFLNALMSENLLPSDVNPCTALLTILRYGPEKRVTIHYNTGQPPAQIDFITFKRDYTIDPEEAKVLEQNGQDAFPDISHAVVEYPLSLLEKGIEIVDSPGLNDTEARNELSLGYLNNCHAVLFVLRASQPCTMAERRYLENYIKGRGLSIFFLVNAWDQIQESLIDPENTDELRDAEERLRKVFRANLAEYCRVDGFDVYDERVFEISAIQALRRCVKDADANLDGTGFPEFIAALNTFLTQERAIAEFRQARTLARQVTQHVSEAIARRIPLLAQDVAELQERITSVEPQFTQLNLIRDQFRDEIRSMRDRKAREIADSFRTYIFDLERTFEPDFLRYQPPSLGFLDLFSQGKREQFEAAFKQAFQHYVNDKFFAWTLTAERELGAAFAELSRSAERYGTTYMDITDQMTARLTGQTIRTRVSSAASSDDSPSWAKWVMGLVSLTTGNVVGAALALGGFDFKSILLNILTTTSIAAIAATLFGMMLGPITLALVGLGVGALQADHARKALINATKQELIRCLPQVAQEQWQPIYSAVQECFDTYEREAIRRINDDIQSRRSELDNLVKQKQTHEIDRDLELDRLNQIERSVINECRHVETIYASLLT
jgi:GTPase SAR1 family protein